MPRIVTQTPFEPNKIISFSLIVYAHTTKKCIILQRKHSVEFLLILSGQYRPSMLLFFLNCITNKELGLLQSRMNQTEFYDLYVNIVGLDKKDVDYAFLRLMESKSIINDYVGKDNDLQWTWPKGRLNIEDKENGFTCACREFYEETEIKLPDPIYVSTNPLLVETIKTLSCKTIETYCWVYIIKDELPFPPLINHKEVNDRQWVPLHDALIKLNQTHLLQQITDELNFL